MLTSTKERFNMNGEPTQKELEDKILNLEAENRRLLIINESDNALFERLAEKILESDAFESFKDDLISVFNIKARELEDKIDNIDYEEQVQYLMDNASISITL